MSVVHLFPDNDSDFETVCCDLLRRYWPCPDLKKYAGDGRPQHGIDLYGLAPNAEGWGVQCKLRKGGRLTWTEIRKEVKKAKHFPLPMARYVIATTAKKDPKIQGLVQAMSLKHLKTNLFRVEVLFVDDLNDYLNQTPETARQLQDGSLFHVTPTVAGLLLATDSEGQHAQGAFHAEIDKARDSIRNNKPDVALAKLQELKDRHWDRLTAREKYRLEANVGHALTLHGNLQATGEAFIRAAAYQPHDNSAAALRAVGLAYTGRETEAFEAASTILAADPDLALAAVAWVSTAPPQHPFADMLSTLSPTVINNSQVSLALSRRARAAHDFDQAELLARRALSGEPNWSEAVEELGELLLHCEVDTLRTRIAPVPRPLKPARVQEALDLLSRAADMSDVRAAPPREAHIRANLSIARELLGDNVGSRSELERARAADPGNSQVVLRYAGALRAEGKPEQALQALRQQFLVRKDSSIAIALSALLFERPSDAHHEEAANAVLDCLHQDQPRADVARDLAEFLVRARTKQSAFDCVRDELAQLKGSWLTVQTRLFLDARLALYKGDSTGAKALAQQALTDAPESLPVDLADRLAALFYELEDHASALSIYKRITPADFIGINTHRLLRCAKHCGDDATILFRCRELRANGLFDAYCLELELFTLGKYNAYDEAIEALHWFLSDPQDKSLVPVMRLHRSLLGLLMGREELIEHDPKRLPLVADATPEIGLMTVQALRFAGALEAAARYAYQLLRRFPDHIEAYKAIMVGLGPPGAETLEFPAPSVVRPGCAFLLTTEEGTKWYVIEEEEEPRFSSNELGPTHPLAMAATGKAKGEHFQWHSGFGSRRGRVDGISHKYVFAWNECLRTCEDRFPEDAFVWGIRPEEATDGASAIDTQLAAVEAQLKKRLDTVQNFLAEYRTQPLPLNVLVRRAGGTQLEAQFFIAEEVGVAVNCGPPDLAAQLRCMEAVGLAKGIVIDTSAIATLLLLDRVADLRRIKSRLFVSRGTLQAIRQLLQPGLAARENGGVFTMQAGRLVLIEEDAERRQRWLTRLEECVTVLEECCEIVSGIALADFEVDTRQTLEGIFGQKSAESLAIARARNLILWTDEFAVGATAAQEFQVPWAWTDAVYRWCARQESISREECWEVAAKLNGLGYTGTAVTGDVLIAAGRLAKWDPDSTPLKNALAVLSGQGADAHQLFLVSRSVMVAVWRETSIEWTAERVILRILGELSKSFEGMRTIQALRKQLGTMFGMDAMSEFRTRTIFESWLRLHR